MFKRFIARLLIFLQIYSSLFQGVAYGRGLLDNLPIQDEIYLHGSYAKDGSLRLSIGTSALTEKTSTWLKDIEIPTYEIVKARSRSNSRASSPTLQPTNHDLHPSSSSLPFSSSHSNTDHPQSLELVSDSSSHQNRFLSPSLSIADQTLSKEGHDGSSFVDAVMDQEDMSDEENAAFESEEGVLRTSEGAHFNIQGLKVFLNNSGEMLIQGKQEDFSKPILLSSDKSIVLHEVEALALKLTSSSIVNVGESRIDFLSLETSVRE